MKKIIAVIFAVLVIFTFVACSSNENENNEEKLITSQNSPDGNYTVCLYQVGIPRWSFGSVNAKLILEDNTGKEIDEVNFELANDGAGVHAKNLTSITWTENMVEVLIDADEAPEECYVLNYGVSK